MSFKADFVDRIPENAVKVESRTKAGKAHMLIQQMAEINKPLKVELKKRSTIITRVDRMAKKLGFDLEIKKDLSNPQVYYLLLSRSKKLK